MERGASWQEFRDSKWYGLMLDTIEEEAREYQEGLLAASDADTRSRAAGAVSALLGFHNRISRDVVTGLQIIQNIHRASERETRKSESSTLTPVEQYHSVGVRSPVNFS